jgi:ABC-type Na+ efflux pump permease subunit
MSLQRVAWLVTTVGFLAAGLILLLSGYQGYAALSAAVGASAAINLR